MTPLPASRTADLRLLNSSPSEAAKFMQNYAKRYSAGAFAMPIRSDIERMQRDGEWREVPGVMMTARKLTRDSARRDFTGRAYTLPAGRTIVTHLAADPEATLPDLSFASAVYAYIEDTNVTEQLRAQGREVIATRVSASSEIIACWGAPGTPRHEYPDWDEATVRQVRLHTPIEQVFARPVLAEVAGLRGWTDDYPFYSDGSWAALNLRGFRRDDPQWGIKPAEMSRAWKEEHPEALAYTCDWTVLAERTPAIVDLVKGLFPEGQFALERVRLLQMAGRGGKGGKLSRHSDITDKAAGVANGKIARFHIPLVTDPAIEMTAWNLDGTRAATHLPPWTMWYLDARKPHAVTNPTGVDRVHLVVDVVSSPSVRGLITSGVEHVR